MVSFFIPDKRNEEGDPKVVQFSEEEIRKLIEKQLNAAKDQISGMVDESINYGMEKTERAMERVSNEKIMAVSEYSDTVLNTIHKNHEEAVFLYDMLNDKHSHLKDTAASVDKSTKQAKEIINNISSTLEETVMAETHEIGMPHEISVPHEISMPHEIRMPNVEPVVESRNDFEQFSENNFEKITLISPDTEPEPQYATIPAVEEKPKAGRGRKRQENILEQLAGATSAGDIDMSGSKKAVVPDTASATNQKAESKGDAASGIKAEDVSSKEKGASMKAEKPAKREPGISFGTGDKNGSVNSNERILALHRLGKSNMAIAKELGLGIGEVNLVLGLFKD